MSLAMATGLCAATAVAAYVLDRRRGIGPISFIPWDLVLIASVIATLLAGTQWLRLWLEA
ncbi:hypothetical protein [Thermaurantiacus sp.]